jgi:hypothetical protein
MSVRAEKYTGFDPNLTDSDIGDLFSGYTGSLSASGYAAKAVVGRTQRYAGRIVLHVPRLHVTVQRLLQNPG